MKVFASRRHRWLAIAGLVAFALALLTIYWTVSTYFPFVYDAEQLRGMLQDFGVLAPVVYVAAHTTQVVFMAIPGYAMAVVGGYIFGAVHGTLYTMIGVTLGSAISFLIARVWGRPVVERMVTEDALARFDDVTESAGVAGLFLFILVPVLPEDVIGFVAGVAGFRLWVFVVISFVGRLPAAAVAVMAGDGVAAGKYVEAGLWISVLLFAIGYTYYYREPILERVETL